MKTKLLLSLLFLGTLLQANAQNVLPAIKPRPADIKNLSSLDSISVRQQLLTPIVTNRNIEATQSLPYPIIFIHGLNSDSKVWDDMRNFMINSLGLSYGGRLDFCLNDNGSNTDNNKLIYPASNADIHRYFNEPLESADFYVVNFDVSWIGVPFTNSSNDVLSNEAAIVKQGIALKLAIAEVLDKTGRNKVILFGHSMGGLAAREYIQNPINWQADGQHHIAKLVTTGTPHGGYEGTALVSLPSDPIDWQSDAYRDLRRSYYISGADGVYLFGGYENYPTMNQNAFTNFYNVDVNCNDIDGDNSYIIGLNYKTWRTDIDYAYIVGLCTGCGGSLSGDGVVRDYNANMSYFTSLLPLPKNEFTYSAIAPIEIHGDLPKQIIQNLQALDEPNFYYLGYGLEFGKTYNGFIYNQPVNGYLNDYDHYQFTINGNNNINVYINTSTNLNVNIYDANHTLLNGPFSGNSSSPINLNGTLPNGNYYLEIYATPGTLASIYPYNITLTNQLSTATVNPVFTLNLSPNPTTSAVFFDNAKLGYTEVQVFNYLGQEVAREQLAGALANQEISLTKFSAGIYVLKFHNGSATATAKVVKQ